MAKSKSFLERLTGNIRLKEEEEELAEEHNKKPHSKIVNLTGKDIEKSENDDSQESQWDEDAQLTCDVYETAGEIIVQTMVAGVTPENLSIAITRDTITIRGKREENQSINSNSFFVQELYWGSFSRVINLPEEIDPEEAEAIEKHGLLIIKLPKIDKNKETKLKIKSI